MKDQRVVETETAEAVVAKVDDWAKLMGFFLGIPLATLAIGFGFWGVKTFSDFSNQVNTALERSISEISVEQERANAAIKIARQPCLPKWKS